MTVELVTPSGALAVGTAVVLFTLSDALAVGTTVGETSQAALARFGERLVFEDVSLAALARFGEHLVALTDDKSGAPLAALARDMDPFVFSGTLTMSRLLLLPLPPLTFFTR